MTRAIELAWNGWGRVAPNPLVGAVVLRAETIVGEGWHAEFGGPHAEAVALAAAGERARDATLVVTLEPCNHLGKQPPCVDAVIAAGVRRVVAALPDPNPVARGGAERLRAAGIDVELGLLSDAACAQNAAFLHGIGNAARPFVALKLATSIDGRIADASGSSRWISGPASRDYVQWLRAGFDGIAVGGETARHDDPSLTVRGPLMPRAAPSRVIFSPSGALPASLALVRTARDVPTLVLTSQTAGHTALADAGVKIVAVASAADGLARLRALGIKSLLIEGGGRLAGALLGAALVDRLYWIQSACWLGAGAVPAFAGIPDQPLAGTPRWQVAERRALGDDTLLTLDREPCSPAW